MTDEEFVQAELWKVAKAARRETAEEIAEAIEELDRSDGQYDEFMVGVFVAARIAREIGAKE